MKRTFFAALFCVAAASAWPGQALAQDYDLGEVVISANKIPTDADKATASVSVVGADEIEERQYGTLGEVLNSVPGAYATSYGDGLVTNFSLRGGRSVDTQLRFDDFPLRDNAGMQQGFDSFNYGLRLHPGALDRVEVLKGAQSTLYGSNATGGVINLYSGNKWDTDPRFSLKFMGGDYGTLDWGAQLAYGTERSYLNFTPFFHRTDGYRDMWFKQVGFNLGWGYRFTEKTTLEFSSMGFRSDTQALNNPAADASTHELTPQSAMSRENHDEGEMVLVGLTLNHEISDFWQTRLKASYTKTDRTSYRPDYFSESNLVGNSTYLEWLNTFRPTPWLTLLAGMDYEHGTIDISDVYEPDTNLSEDADSWSVFAKAMLELLDERLTLSAGSRYSRHDNHGGHLTFDLGASYRFDFGLKLYANVASAYRAPSLYENYAKTIDWDPMTWLPFVKTIGDENLKPEKSVSYEFGLEQALWNDRIVLGGAAFRTDYKDQISAMPWSPATGIAAYENLDKSRSQGAELYLNLFPHEKLRFDLAYTYVDVQNKRRDEDSWSRSYNQPYNRVSGTLSLYPLAGLSLSLTGRWQDNSWTRIGGVDLHTDGFFTMDVAATYDINKHLSLYAKANNLFDKSYWVSGYRMVGFNCSAGLQVAF